MVWLNTLRPRQNGRHFADDIFKCIFLNENARISLKISLKFVPKVRINDIPALVQIMAWRRPGDKPLSAPMMVSLLTHLCGTRGRWFDNVPRYLLLPVWLHVGVGHQPTSLRRLSGSLATDVCRIARWRLSRHHRRSTWRLWWCDVTSDRWHHDMALFKVL